MKITLRRIGERQHVTTALRDDGVTVRVPSYGPSSPMPHDLAHIVVETQLGLEDAFWGTVAAGALLPGMSVIDGRQPPHAAARSKSLAKANRRAMIAAEVLVDVLVHGLRIRPADRPAFVQAELEERSSSNTRIGDDELRRVNSALTELRTRWQGLAVGDELSLDWPGQRGSQTGRRRKVGRRRTIVHTQPDP